MGAGETFVIVGAGQAGGRAAEAMRKANFQGRVVLIGEEPHPPYERPPLSKAVLIGDKAATSTSLLPASFYTENRIELLTGVRATAIDANGARIMLDDGKVLGYTKLLLTTGGRVRTLPFAPFGRAGVHYLRTIEDSLALRAAIKTAPNFAVIGGGFLGLEAAASARRLGARVSVLELKPHLLDRAMAPDIARYVEAMHRRQGVDIHLGVEVSDLVGNDALEAVVLRDGTHIPADLALIAVGIVPQVELAAQAGARIEDGIAVDEFGRTSLPNVFAAGDAANHLNPILGRRLRLESWQCAQNQAIAVARVMCGEHSPYAEVPWFWSDQFDANIQMIGVPPKTDRVVVRGDPASGRFLCVNLSNGVVEGATAFNMGGEIRFMRKLIEVKARVDAADIASPATKLKDMAARFSP
ncbi:MAG TPA: FAD-dependent oxidoreductase [Alphaproteobacteria bacterium]|nr:FAD-dependent oxidoreductase [Alphaproteobacteria bacterium]